MIGYEFLLSRITRPMMPPGRPARIAPVTRKEPRADSLAIPRNVAPTEVDILSHVLFALKHEDLNIAILHEALSLVPAEEMLAALLAQPASAYIRQACFFWEKANGRPLPGDLNNMGGNYVDVFDPETYYTGQVWERHQRYRVNFNGIGLTTIALLSCATRSWRPREMRSLPVSAPGSVIHSMRKSLTGSWDGPTSVRPGTPMRSNTETPSPGKEQAFLQAMEQLREKTPLSEEYLVQLQNTVISSPLAHEQQFRAHQNWLQRGGHGALSVRYVPPSPDGMLRLMAGFMRMANAQDDVPALIKAALVSFGFVYIHPLWMGTAACRACLRTTA